MFSPARLALFGFSACLLNLNKSVMALMLTPLPKRRVICRQIKDANMLTGCHAELN